MVSSVLRITSRVEHTKKRNSIDSENKSVKWNANHQNRLTVCFYMLLYSTTIRQENVFDLNRALWRQALASQVSVIVQSIGRLQQLFCQCFTNKCCQKYEFYRRKGYRKSNAICIMAIMSSTLWRPLYLFFSSCSTLYRLEVIPRCCNNLSYIFINTYISTVKHPKQNKWFDK